MHSTGTIKILARVASGRMNGQLWLMNALTDRFIVLHGRSEALWQKTEQGATVAELIDDQVTATGVPRDTAAFEVIAFLDELRAHGFVEFQLPAERTHAPLLDTPLSAADLKGRELTALLRGERAFDEAEGRFVKLAATDGSVLVEELIQRAKQEADSPDAETILVVAHPSSKLTIGRILDRARLAYPDLDPESHRLVVFRGAAPDLDLATLQGFLDGTNSSYSGQVDSVWLPNPDLTLDEVGAWGTKRGGLGGLIVARKGLLIIIAAWFLYDYIARGKSRHACKMVCV